MYCRCDVPHLDVISTKKSPLPTYVKYGKGPSLRCTNKVRVCNMYVIGLVGLLTWWRNIAGKFGIPVHDS
jgi:hypothetical protein